MNKSKLLALTTGLTLAATGAMTASAQAATYTLDFNKAADGTDNILYNDNGTLVTTQWKSWGLADITGTNDRHGSDAKFNIYNTDVYSGNNSVDRDIDLTTGIFNAERDGNKTKKSSNQTLDTGVENQGGVLIIQEEDGNSFKNGKYVADDEARGGNISFIFDRIVNFKGFSLLDIDDNGGGIMVEGTKKDGSPLSIDIDALMAEHHRIKGTTQGKDTQGTSVMLGGVKMTQVGYLQGDNSMFKFEVSDAHLADVRFSYPGSGAISELEWGMVEVPQEIPEPSAIGGLLMLGFIGKRLKSKRDQAATA